MTEITEADLVRLEKLADKATPGKRVVGYWSGQGEKHCDCSSKGPLVATHPAKSHPEWGLMHVHANDLCDDGRSVSLAIPSMKDNAIVGAGNFDEGFARPEDAALTQALDRETVLSLIVLARDALALRQIILKANETVGEWFKAYVDDSLVYGADIALQLLSIQAGPHMGEPK